MGLGVELGELFDLPAENLEILALLVAVPFDGIRRVGRERDLCGQRHQLIQDRAEAIGPGNLVCGELRQTFVVNVKVCPPAVTMHVAV